MAVSKRKGTWYIDFYDQFGRRRREAVGPNKKEAELVLAKRLAQVREGEFFDVRKLKKTTFEQIKKRYLKYSRAHKRSHKRDLTSTKTLSKTFSGKMLRELEQNPILIEDYKNERSKAVTNSTVNRELACLKHMFTMAINWGIANENPVKRVKMLKENPHRIRCLEFEEIDRLVESCSGIIRHIVEVAVNTGMRFGELISLLWEQVDWENEVIHLVKTKNDERRDIPMNDIVYGTLRKLPRHIQVTQYFLPRRWIPR